MTRLLSTEWLQLLLATALALSLRTVQLQTLPAALNRDEAALGYNAWMLQTLGVDEWGERWPVALRSFGDYKLPGYPLMTVLSFNVFGRSDMAVRLPSALAGSLLPIAVWYLLKQAQFARRPRILATWLSAVAPFSIFYSRIAFEASVALTLFVFVIGLVIQSQAKIQPSWKLQPLIATLLLLSIFTYNTPLLLAPFLGIALVIYGFGRSWRPVAVTVVTIIAPMLVAGVFLWQLSQQKAGISIFSDPTITAQIAKQYASASSPGERLLASRYLVYLKIITHNFFASWTPDFLVIRGGSHPWHTIPQAAHSTWFGYVMGLVGVGWSVTVLLKALPQIRRWSTHQRSHALLVWMLIMGLAPAVITVDAPHATRSLLFLTLLLVFAAIGIDRCMSWIEQKKPALVNITYTILLSWALICSGRYLSLYFTAYPTTQSMFQPGLAEVLPSIANSNKPILVAGDGYTYISLAWYQPIEPNQFLATIQRHPVDTIGFLAGKSVGNYTIRPDFQTPAATESGLLFWQDSGWHTTQLP